MTDIDQSRLDLFATEHAVHGDRIRALQIDATDEDAVRGAVSEVVDVHGQLDVVIANAGGGAGGSVTETSTDDWHRTIALNLDSLFYVARAGLPNLTASGGSIVATASSSGLNGWPHQAAYVAAKAGVVNLVRSMPIDYAAEGVRVNAVAPGPTMTPAVEEHLRTSPGTQAGYEDRIPMGRLGRPDEIVAAALFLASSAASYVTGVTIPVDGGLTAWTALVRVGAILTAIALGAFPALASNGLVVGRGRRSHLSHGRARHHDGAARHGGALLTARSPPLARLRHCDDDPAGGRRLRHCPFRHRRDADLGDGRGEPDADGIRTAFLMMAVLGVAILFLALRSTRVLHGDDGTPPEAHAAATLPVDAQTAGAAS